MLDKMKPILFIALRVAGFILLTLCCLIAQRVYVLVGNINQVAANAQTTTAKINEQLTPEVFDGIKEMATKQNKRDQETVVAIQQSVHDFDMLTRLHISPAVDSLNKLIIDQNAGLNNVTKKAGESFDTLNGQVTALGKQGTQTIANINQILTGPQIQETLNELAASVKGIHLLVDKADPAITDLDELMASLVKSGINVEKITTESGGIMFDLHRITTDLANQVDLLAHPPKPVGFIGHIKYILLQLSPILHDGYLVLKLLGQVP